MNPYIDPAGVGANLYNAINKYTNHEARHIVGIQTYFNVPDFCILNEFAISGNDKLIKDKIVEIVENSDLIHFNMFGHDSFFRFHVKTDKISCGAVIRFMTNLKKYIKRIPFIYHDHGIWMEGRESYGEYMNGKLFNKYNDYAGIVVCSPSAIGVYNGSIWLPNIIPQNDEHYLPIERDWDGDIYIAHSPSNRRFKGTNIIIDIIDELQKKGYPIKLILIENTNHENVMKMRQKCNIVIDSCYDSYPNLTSFEGMSQGQVAITRVTDEYMKYYNEIGDEPMPIITIKNSLELKGKLIFLLDNRDKLKEFAYKSREWIEKYYADYILIKKWVKFYEEVYEKWQK